MRAVQLTDYGDLAGGLKIVDIPAPGAPGPNQVLIGMEYAPVDPSDLLLAMGVYALRPVLPSVIGNEGVGVVLAVGPGVSGVQIGDRVLAPLSSLTWRERMVVPAEGLFALPAEADPKQLAMLAINPVTAALLLSEFVDLRPGDWVVQNAANSGVGRAVIAFAKERDLKTANIVRRAELAAELEAAGADLVVADGADVAQRVTKAVGGAEFKLALDGVSGPATGALAAILSPHGTIVSYAAMSGAPISLSPFDVIFKPLTLAGFFLGHSQHAAKFPALIKQAARLIAAGKLCVPVAAVYPLAAVKEAVAHVQRGGKVLLDIAGS
jgi:NADPH:quinone reductase-like Zn-dependent oxidoreductase